MRTQTHQAEVPSRTHPGRIASGRDRPDRPWRTAAALIPLIGITAVWPTESRALAQSTPDSVALDKLGRPLQNDSAKGNRATAYHALIIANDEGAEQNDHVETALLNWNSWKNGAITLKDDRDGAQIIADITAWVANIDSDDVAIFYYVGHGGAREDLGEDETPGTDPVADNDGLRKVDEVIGVKGDDMDDHADDDSIRAALGVLPAQTTLLTVFDMCKANGEALGTSDVDGLINTAVLTASAEANATTVFFGWTPEFIKGLFDGADGDAFADADANQDGQLSAQELATWAESRDAASDYNSNLAGTADRPICTGKNDEQVDPGAAGGDGGQGFDGCGVCSNPDCGDLPDSYKTLIGSDGPRYNEWIFQWLGDAVDSEEDGQPTPLADGDDGDPEGDDDDGVAMGPNYVDVIVTIDYTKLHDYRLDAWFDLNEDGSFSELSEHIIDSRYLYTGSSGGLLKDLSTGVFGFYYGLSFDPRKYYSRFRLTFGIDIGTNILSYGEYDAGDGGSHGEVEDYPPTTSCEDLLITEVVDGTLPGGQPKWVELTNTGDLTLDLCAYSFGSFNNGSTTLGGGAATVLTGILPAQASYIISYEADGGPGGSIFYSVYGADPDFYMGAGFVNGDDALALFLDPATGDGSDATLVDVYGEIGTDGTGTSWDYVDSFSYRCGEIANGGVWDDTDWHFEGPNGLEAGCGGDDACEEQNLVNWTTPWVHPGCGASGPGVGYCFGDGSGTPCPCSNNNDGSVPGSGCANGVFASGAKLVGGGTASVSGDTLVLSTTGLEPTNFGLYFQADNKLNGGHGVVFGDGLRCAGGALIRLQTRMSDGTGASSTNMALGVKGGVSSGDVKRYQCWYRNPAASPCGSDFNVSNGYEVAWTP